MEIMCIIDNTLKLQKQGLVQKLLVHQGEGDTVERGA